MKIDLSIMKIDEHQYKLANKKIYPIKHILLNEFNN